MRNFYAFLSIMFVALVAHARPPEDKIDFKALEDGTRKKPRALLDKDITFTEDDIEKKLEDPRVMRVRFDVVGRTLPQRTGKPLERFVKGSLVKVQQVSKNQQWVVVESMKSNRKRWLPRSALPKFSPEILKEKKEASEN